MSFDFTNELEVLAATIYGEASGCGAEAMQDVGQCILNRKAASWQPTVIEVCLAPYQFSCWNYGTRDRQRILTDWAITPQNAIIAQAKSIAAELLSGKVENRIGNADSYYALTMKYPPRWANPPAVHTFSDEYHTFWEVRPTNYGHTGANVSHMSTSPEVAQQETTAELNEDEFKKVDQDDSPKDDPTKESGEAS